MTNRLMLLKIVLVVSVAALSFDNADGQNNPFENEFEFNNNDPRYFTNVKSDLSNLFTEYRYQDIYWYLKEDFITQDSLWQSTTSKIVKNSFIEAIDYFTTHLDSVLSNDTLSIDKVHAGFFQQMSMSDIGAQFVTYFYHHDFKIELNLALINEGEATDLRYRIKTFERVSDVLSRDSRINTEKELSILNQQWNNFHFSTRSQYPWEFLLNSKFIYSKDRPLVKPPGFSMILLHPNASFTIDFSEATNLKAYQTLSLEVLGGAWHFNDFKNTLGFSVLFTINNETGNGYGAMLSFNNTKVGASLNDLSFDGINLTFSIDLFKFFQPKGNGWDSIKALVLNE